MTTIRGNRKIIVDSDALIGLIHEDDLLHEKCVKISQYLSQNSFATIISYPIVLEAATTLAKDKTIKRPDLAQRLLKDYTFLEKESYQESGVSELVARLYDSKTSRRNSPFDYFVLAVAKRNKIPYVFSFDSFYKKQGLTLAKDLLSGKRAY